MITRAQGREQHLCHPDPAEAGPSWSAVPRALPCRGRRRPGPHSPRASLRGKPPRPPPPDRSRSARRTDPAARASVIHRSHAWRSSGRGIVAHRRQPEPAQVLRRVAVPVERRPAARARPRPLAGREGGVHRPAGRAPPAGREEPRRPELASGLAPFALGSAQLLAEPIEGGAQIHHGLCARALRHPVAPGQLRPAERSPTGTQLGGRRPRGPCAAPRRARRERRPTCGGARRGRCSRRSGPCPRRAACGAPAPP